MRELEVQFKPNSESTDFSVLVLLFLQISKWLHMKPVIRTLIRYKSHSTSYVGSTFPEPENWLSPLG